MNDGLDSDMNLMIKFLALGFGFGNKSILILISYHQFLKLSVIPLLLRLFGTSLDLTKAMNFGSNLIYLHTSRFPKSRAEVAAGE